MATSFGVVYAITPHHKEWVDMLELSRSTLPRGTDVHVIECDSFRQTYEMRLSMTQVSPFDKTIYLDADVVYMHDDWPAWVVDWISGRHILASGIGMTGWHWTSQIWMEPGSRVDQLLVGMNGFRNLRNIMEREPMLIPSAGLMLVDKNGPAEEIYKAWGDELFLHWDEAQSAEMAYVRKFRGKIYDYIPPWFHLPHRSLIGPAIMLMPQYYFVHAVGPNKLTTMRSLLENHQSKLEWDDGRNPRR